MSSYKNICNHDCFNCKYKDCKYSGVMLKEESHILKNAHGGWEQEENERKVLYMFYHGCTRPEIQAYLHLNKHEVNNIIKRRTK